jgi:hypothetical protein
VIRVDVRPATPADASASGCADLLPDRWREGNNRRSFVAVDDAGRVLGHCRGIDNDFHPASRVLVLEVLGQGGLGAHPGDPRRADVEDALVRAQVQVSSLPLHLKPTADDREAISLCSRHGGVLIQLMPPWRYEVGPALRAWADVHRAVNAGSRVRRAATGDPEAMLDFYVEHYAAQHATWSPAAPPDVLREENRESFTPGSEDAFEPDRSVVLLREGRIAAQALVWPAEPDGSREVSSQALPYEGPAARADAEACLAAVIDHSADGDVLLIDSHVTEPMESAMMRDLRAGVGPDPSAAESSHADPWTAIVAIPVAGGPEPIPLPADAVPEEAAEFVRALVVEHREVPGHHGPRLSSRSSSTDSAVVIS